MYEKNVVCVYSHIKIPRKCYVYAVRSAYAFCIYVSITNTGKA